MRSVPGSRRHPHFGRTELEEWMSAAGIGYRWEPELGGFRRPVAGSPNAALRHPSFRGYADYMATDVFDRALDRLLDEASRLVVAAMCAETLWWRCHRRLIADAVTLLHGTEVCHLGHEGRLSVHRLTDGVRVEGQHLIYDAGQPRLGPTTTQLDERPGPAEPTLPGDRTRSFHLRQTLQDGRLGRCHT
ncbi:MAG: DUF488 family protein [Acidimicrobiales bacterium]